MKAVYFFCCDESKDPVAKGIFDQVLAMHPLEETTITFDGLPVLQYKDKQDNLFLFAQTTEVLSHKTDYLEELGQFAEFDYAGIVNWHEGRNAPSKILTVHTNGDVPSGNFSRANPLLNRNMIQALEINRQLFVLDDFSTKTEATHWSGIVYDQSPNLIPMFTVPLVDIEIGSELDSWKNPVACQVIAKSLVEVFDRMDQEIIPILYFDGEHFDQDLANIAINSDFPFAFCHHLPNQWIQNYIKKSVDPDSGEKLTEPSDDSAEKLKNCMDSIIGGVKAIFFHEGIGGPLRNLVKDFAEQYHVPVFKHKALRDPAKLLKELQQLSNPARPRLRMS